MFRYIYIYIIDYYKQKGRMTARSSLETRALNRKCRTKKNNDYKMVLDVSVILFLCNSFKFEMNFSFYLYLL